MSTFRLGGMKDHSIRKGPESVGTLTTEVNTPLCVDLDGTLVHTDLLLEAILLLIKQNFISIYKLPLWLLKGKAYFKQQIADRVDLDVGSLPYNQPFLEFLKEQRDLGRSIILVTASNRKYAEQIAQYLGLFDEIMASDHQTNLTGHHKRQRLLDAFGENGFGYAGNALVDLQIWPYSKEVILVTPEAGVKKRAEKLVQIHRIFDAQRGLIKPLIKALRLHQWTKNLLVFVPLVMAHKILEVHHLLFAGIAFLVFGICASSVYLLNDLLDLFADRKHSTKRHRPFASGTLSIKHGVIVIPLLLLAAFSIALLLPLQFLGVLTLYFVITLAYSLVLKHSAVLDVLVLAGLYTLRIIAGAAAIAVTPSFWLLAFSIFFFFSLALVKRYAELLTIQKEKGEEVGARGYMSVDLETLAQSGIASGFMAVLVMALYINGEPINELYTHPEMIWLICPLLLYWISRVWLLTRRGEMHEDPVVFAIKDNRSHWLGIMVLCILWLAK